MQRLIILILTFTVYSNHILYSQNYPIPPKTDKRLFYIQRNHNSNTIIYDANYNSSGQLISDKPVDVYWLRYDEDGRRMELRTIEKKFAYGVKSKKLGKPNQYELELVAYDKRKLLLKKTSDNKFVAYMKIGGTMSILDHLYIFADNSSWWPKVKYIELFGYDAKTGSKTYEKIKNEE